MHFSPSRSQVVALGEPAWYAYRDVAPEAGHYKVRIDYTNARKAAEMTPAAPSGGGSGAKQSGRRWWWPWGGGKEKQQKEDEDEDDDSTAIWYINKWVRAWAGPFNWGLSPASSCCPVAA